MASAPKLPQVDHANVLKRRSAKALADVFPDDQFILREEGGDDFGVDFTLELILSGAATNFRSQVQLKAVDQPELRRQAAQD